MRARRRSRTQRARARECAHHSWTILHAPPRAIVVCATNPRRRERAERLCRLQLTTTGSLPSLRLTLGSSRREQPRFGVRERPLRRTACRLSCKRAHTVRLQQTPERFSIDLDRPVDGKPCDEPSFRRYEKILRRIVPHCSTRAVSSAGEGHSLKWGRVEPHEETPAAMNNAAHAVTRTDVSVAGRRGAGGSGGSGPSPAWRRCP